MRRTWLLFLIVFISVMPLFAQENDDEDDSYLPSIDSDWDSYTPDIYSLGDKIFTVSGGVLFPTVFAGPGVNPDNSQPYKNIIVGGIGSLAYSYFLNAHFFVGGEVSGVFAATIGKNMLYIIPFGAHVGYQFLLGRFEFPVSFMIGGAPQLHAEKSYFGMIFKPSVSGYFRFSSDWSFGLNVKWWMLPQWPKGEDIGRDVLGNFLELTLTARYHF